ncbi:MAG: PIN domain-containing protein [Acidobacteriota bacterium]|nr:PIN domain-containing protein [Acidobacteriota bacterium]
MKDFLDTSVLIATFYGEHEHHEASFELFLRSKKQTACTAAHSLAEVYSVLTGMPGKDRASPDEALLFIGDIRDRLSVVYLEEEEYAQMLKASAGTGVIGGSIYDAILGRCAIKAGAKALYSWNVKHFKRLGPEIAGLVRTP